MKFDSQEYMGRNQLLKRLASQVVSTSLAIGILIDRGDMKPDGKTLTEQGKKRNDMTAEERAIDRAVKQSKRNPSEYKYNPYTNRATLKNK